MTNQDIRYAAYRDCLQLRNLEDENDPHKCKNCGGWGWTTYGSTATWHSGIGGQAMTLGVCDKCWGSGNQDRPWPSHARYEQMEAEIKRLNAKVEQLVNGEIIPQD